MKKLLLTLILIWYNSGKMYSQKQNANTIAILENISGLISEPVKKDSPNRWLNVRDYLTNSDINTYDAKVLANTLKIENNSTKNTIIQKTSQLTFDRIYEIIMAKAEGGYTDRNGQLKKIIYTITITKEPDTTPKISDDEFKLVIVPMPDNIAYLNNFLFKDGKIKKGHTIKGPDTKNSCYYFYNYTMELAKNRSNFQIQDMQESNYNINSKINSAFNLLSTQKSVTIKL